MTKNDKKVVIERRKMLRQFRNDLNEVIVDLVNKYDPTYPEFYSLLSSNLGSWAKQMVEDEQDGIVVRPKADFDDSLCEYCAGKLVKHRRKTLCSKCGSEPSSVDEGLLPNLL